MWHRGIPIVLVALVACKSKSPGNATAGSGSARPSAAAAVDAAAAKPAGKPAPGKLAPAQLVELRTHLKAAWAAQKAKKWADAVAELDAALKVAPGNARVLSELGWSAMNAGDLAKARTIDEQAVRVAIEPKLKAAGLFNLGMVQAKLGDTAAAQQSFTQSLALRPNKTVEAELAKLGGAADSSCPAGKPACYCAALYAWGSVGDDVLKSASEDCKPSETKSPVPGWKVVHVAVLRGSQEVLVDEHDQAVTAIAGEDESMRSELADELQKADIRTIGGHRVVWIEMKSEDLRQTMDEDLVTDDTSTRTTVTICAIGDAKTPTRCAVQDAPLRLEQSIDRYKLAEDGTPQPGTHEGTETVVDYKIADDGTVTAKLVRGKADEVAASALGTHKLW